MELGRLRSVATRTIDVLLMTLCLLVSLWQVHSRWLGLPWWVVATAGIGGSVAQWSRRRRPRLAAFAGVAAALLGGNPVALVLGLYAMTVYGPRRQVWALALLSWATFSAWVELGAHKLDRGHARLDWGSVLAWGWWTGLIVATGLYIGTRRAVLASLRERAALTEADQRRREEQARHAERTRIAREMHDVLAHKVALIALHAGALELTATEDPERVRQGVALIRVTAREALHELRDVLGVLQDGHGHGEWFPDLASLVDSVARAGQPVQLSDQSGTLPAGAARVVYRIVQEGLTNAYKHAPGAVTAVSVRRADGGPVTVTVANAAPPGAPTDLPGAGQGLIGLAERIRLVGGTLHSGPDDAGGWRLCAEVPCLDRPAVDEVNWWTA